MDISVIIVNYNTKDFLYNCLSSIYRHTKGLDFEIIVSDNGSTDGSLEMLKEHFPGVRIIATGRNIGFGAANNRGLEIAKGKYIFYLNSDTIFLNNALEYFYRYFEAFNGAGDLGALGCNLLDKDMNITFSGGSFPGFSGSLKKFLSLLLKLSLKSLLRILRINYEALRPAKAAEKKITGETGYISGADLFMPRDGAPKFDERFFLYYEETDLQYRLYESGKKRVLIEGPLIQHLAGGSNKITDDFEMYASFPVLQSFISCLLYFYNRKQKNILLLKIIFLLILCNPLLIKKTYKYIGKIISLRYD
jgi:GT2 family glycosyltransferase